MSLKLTIELVPETCWHENLRRIMSRKDWDTVRRNTYAASGHKCDVCGETDSQLNCHEIWQYDDEHYIQTLKGFTTLCTMCHHVKHIAFAGILANQGKLDFDKVVEHFMKVNGCGKEIFKQHAIEANEVWKKRSAHEWQTDLGEHAGLVKDEQGDVRKAAENQRQLH